MKARTFLLLGTTTIIALGQLGATDALAQAPREDVFWARTASGPITLDGVLDETSWALAETKILEYGKNAGIPGSGWKVEAGAFIPTDSTYATLKLLVHGNKMYLGAHVEDVSVGGSAEFNRFDGLLMAIKDHADPGHPRPPSEYFYSWWYPDSLPDPQPPGQSPNFVGRWGSWPPGAERTPEAIENWDAVTVVHGISNSDTTLDTGYTVEMCFNLTPMGYDVTQPGGDVIEWNVAIYDSDFFWPFAPLIFSTNRVWWQSPWGNDKWYNEVRVYARPDVTVNSGPLPPTEPDFTLYEIRESAPTIDGALTEPVWDYLLTYDFDIAWDDTLLYETYPGVGPFRAGQFQSPVNGGLAAILDPADATVKMFFRDDILYMGFDVRDRVVQSHPDINRKDGFWVTVSKRDSVSSDNQVQALRLTFTVDDDGTALADDYLTTLLDNGDAEVAINLNPGTTVDTLGQQPDNGYTAELAIDLTAMGYPTGLGDGILFIGISHLDGDSFTPFTDSYGTRSWWFREFEGQCCPAWVHMQPTTQTAVEDIRVAPPGYRILGVYPNPSATPRIQYKLAEPSRVTLEILDVQGRLIKEKSLGVLVPGLREVTFDGRGFGGGLYFYRLKVMDPVTGRLRTVLPGKLIIL